MIDEAPPIHDHEYDLWHNSQRILEKLRYLPPLWNKKYQTVETLKFSHPVDMKTAWITQEFGANPALYRPMAGHDGRDYGLSEGRECAGPVDEMEVTDTILQKNSYGRHVTTIDTYGHRYIFGHLHEFLCQKKDIIKRGQVFATTGGGLQDPYRGYSTGPHLHWEWRPVWASLLNGYGGAEDQKPYMTFGPVTFFYPGAPESLGTGTVKNLLGLTVRAGPSIKAKALRYLVNNQTFDYYAVNQQEVFLKISPTKEEYVALVSGGKAYSEMEAK